MNDPKFIIVHCSDSHWGCAREITEWHKQRGWGTIGYNFVILNGRPDNETSLEQLNGSIEVGRKIKEIGAHTIGYNSKSIGICLIGIKDFTHEQIFSLNKLLLELCKKFKIEDGNVLGHCETESGKQEGKTCPNINLDPIRLWLKSELAKG